jgi:hypothetical protein
MLAALITFAAAQDRYTSEVLPFLHAPFDGERPASGFYDHRGPTKVNDHRQLTAWGSLTWGKAGHAGYDWPMPVGTPVLAAADGVVLEAGDFGPVTCGGAENDRDVRVRVQHQVGERTFVTSYFHLDAVGVAVGDEVRSGDPIGRSGNTGCSSGPHLHFGVWEKLAVHGRMVDPYGWDASVPDPLLGFTRHHSAWLWVEAPLLFRPMGPSRHPARGDVVISGFRGMAWQDERHPGNEFVQLAVRRDGPRQVDLSGWTIRNRDPRVYTFPEGARIERGTPLRLYSSAGRDTEITRFWGQTAGVWRDDGDCVELRDARGRLIHVQHQGRRDEGWCDRIEQ